MGLSDFFFKNEADTAKPAAPVSTQQAQVQPVVQTQYVAPSQPSGTVDAKFMKHFEGILEKANIPGADFYEFSKTLEGMTAMNLSEQQTYQMAFIAFKSMNPGKTDSELVTLLSSTAKIYLDTLTADKTNFEEAISKETQAKVGNLQKDQEQIVSRQTAIDDEINRLQQERQENQEKLIKVGSDIQIQTSRIVSNHNNYKVSFDAVTKAISQIVDNVNRYNGTP